MDLIEMSLAGAFMILVVSVIRKITLHWLPKQVFTILWGLVTLRLLLPFSISSMLGIYLPASSAKPKGSKILSFSATGKESLMRGAITIWGIGMLLCAFVFLVCYLRSHRRFSCAQPIAEGITEIYSRNWYGKRKAAIKQCEFITAPLTYGIWHPVILFPQWMDFYDEKELSYILLHESIHIKHLDTLKKIILAAVLCIHWFNPFVWLMFRLANRDIEMACDEAVLRVLGEKEKASYARALIALEEKKAAFIPLCNYFSNHLMKERMKAIMKLKKLTKITVTAAIVIVAALGVVYAASGLQKPSGSDNGKIYADEVSNDETETSDSVVIYVPDNDAVQDKNSEWVYIPSVKEVEADSNTKYIEDEEGSGVFISE